MDHSLFGTFIPVELLLHGTFAPLDLSFFGTFAPEKKKSHLICKQLSFHNNKAAELTVQRSAGKINNHVRTLVPSVNLFV